MVTDELASRRVAHDATGHAQARAILSVDVAGARRRATAGWIASAGLVCLAINLLFSRYLFWDSYLDLGAGRYVAAHGIPHREALTIAGQGRPWVDQQWLAHWLYYEAWRAGGYPGVAGISSLLVAGAFAGLAALLVRRGVPAQRAAMWTLLAFVACMGNTVIRAQSFAFPLFVLLLWLLLEDSRAPRFHSPVALLLPALALWSNLHGTVVLAAGLVAGHSLLRSIVMAKARAWSAAGLYAAVGAAAPLTILANPYGSSVLGYYRSLIGNPVLAQYIVEWSRPSLAYTVSLPFFGLLLLVIGGVAYAARRAYRPQPTLVLIAGALLALASQAVRNQAWFALAAVVLGAEAFAYIGKPPTPLAAPVRRAAAAVLVMLTLGMVVRVATTPDSEFERLAPHGALAAASVFAAGHPEARILADDVSSSSLLWLYPNTLGRVGFDARLERPRQSELRRWFQFMSVDSPQWLVVADGYDVIVVSARKHPTLAEQLRRQPGWRVLHQDADGVVFVRRAAT